MLGKLGTSISGNLHMAEQHQLLQGDPKIWNPKQWNGTNVLGNALMQATKNYPMPWKIGT